MSVERAKELISEKTTTPGTQAALDPAVVTLILTVLGQFLQNCKKRGETATAQVAMLRSPAKHIVVHYRNALRKQLGSSTYKKLGGPRFVDNLVSASSGLKVTEARTLVKELAEQAE